MHHCLFITFIFYSLLGVGQLVVKAAKNMEISKRKYTTIWLFRGDKILN